MIPRILHRTCPAVSPAESEEFWSTAEGLHPGWELRTYRDPLDPDEWPITSPHWGRCRSGAQLAGLIRLEALLASGGVYLDQDVEPFRPFDPLLSCEAFAAWEDRNTVPDAVVGAVEGHPAIAECLVLAIDRLDRGPWASGPGVFTEVLPGRTDVLLLPPGAFYPYHYTEKHRRHEGHAEAQPWAFAAHHWHGSWLGEG